VKPGRVLIGLALVALGVLFLLDRAGTLDAGNVIGDWWPVAIIGLGLIQLAERPRSFFGPAMVIAAGMVVLLFTTDVLEGNVFTIIWPLLLILVGIGILARDGRGRGSGAGISSDDVVKNQP
jgi:cell wall-active antibiotic response 4TMS protein YvqF